MRKAKSSIVVVGAISALLCTLAGFYFGGQVTVARNDEDDVYGFSVRKFLEARKLKREPEITLFDPFDSPPNGSQYGQRPIFITKP